MSDRNSPHLVQEPHGFDYHKLIFQSVSITAAGAFAVLVGFLGDTWNEPEAAKATLIALTYLLFSLAPCVVLVFFTWFFGGAHHLLLRRKNTLNRLLPLLSLATFVLVAVAMFRWLSALSAIVKPV